MSLAGRALRGGNRRDDSAVLAQLGWEFVKGTVVSTVNFGAFVEVHFIGYV